MRNHPDVGRCLVRCRYCGIRFLTHPCNARRRDLLCPLGCRKEHQRQAGNRRSAEHYQTPKGNKNKKARNRQRSCRARSALGVGEPVDLTPPDDSATSNSCPRESVQPISTPSAPKLTSAEDSEHAKKTPPCRGWLVLEAVRLNEARVKNSPMLSYLRIVASVIEGRTIGRDELVQALLTTMRQRSLSARPRTTYVLDYLNRHPP